MYTSNYTSPFFILLTCRKKRNINSYSPSCHRSPPVFINQPWPKNFTIPNLNTNSKSFGDDCTLIGYIGGPSSVSASSCTSDDQKLVVETQVGTPESSQYSLSSVSTPEPLSVMTPEPPELEQCESLDTPPSPQDVCHGYVADNVTETFQKTDPLGESLVATPKNKNSLSLPTLYTPLKALSEAAKKLFNEDTGAPQKMNLVFISPSKRKPRRVDLTLNVAKNSATPNKRNTFLSAWEEEHNALNLDKHRTTRESTENSEENNDDGEELNYKSVEDASYHLDSVPYSNDSTSPSSMQSGITLDDSIVSNDDFSFSTSNYKSPGSYTPLKHSFGSNDSTKTKCVSSQAPNTTGEDNFIFKTPNKTPSKVSNRRPRTIYSSSSGSPSPKQVHPAQEMISTPDAHPRSHTDTPDSEFKNIPNGIRGSRKDSHGYASETSPAQENENTRIKENYEIVGSPCSSLILSRRSSRLKDGVVKSLFNKNVCDQGMVVNCTKIVATSKEMTEPDYSAGNYASKFDHLLDQFEKYSTSTTSEVLVNLDVNRELVPQLTPRKKQRSIIAESKNEENVRSTKSVKRRMDASYVKDNCKMGEALTNALGLVPNKLLNKNTTDDRSQTLDNTSTISTGSMVQNNNAELERTLRNPRTQEISSNMEKSSKNDVASSLKENSFDNKSVEISTSAKIKSMSEVPDRKTNEDNCLRGTIIKRHGRTENTESSQCIPKNLPTSSTYNFEEKKKLKVNKSHEVVFSKKTHKDKQKRNKDLSSVVRPISNHGSHDYSSIEPWPSPEDIKKAYLELNLSPPESPNDAF